MTNIEHLLEETVKAAVALNPDQMTPLEYEVKYTRMEGKQAELLAAIRELERPTHAYCIVEAPGYDRGEVLHISLDKAETEAVIERMNNPRSWDSEEGPYEIWTVELGLPTVEMMDDEDLAEWKPELLKDAPQ